MRIEYYPIDTFDSVTGWAVLGNDTTNLAASSTRLLGLKSLEFDKANGAANTVYAGAAKTVDLNLGFEDILPWDYIVFTCYLSALTNVANAFVKLGTDATNNLEFRDADTNLQAGWNFCQVRLADALLNGTGWDPENIDYLQVGVTFDAETDALADIKFDGLYLRCGKGL